jgi:hypothetical protein
VVQDVCGGLRRKDEVMESVRKTGRIQIFGLRAEQVKKVFWSVFIVLAKSVLAEDMDPEIAK